MARSRWTTIAALLAAATALGTAVGFAHRVIGTKPARPNVVLISIDSLRADHVGAYGYGKPTTPAIDRLAREGAVFSRAVSTTSWTLPAHAALLTGQNDIAHTVTDDRYSLPSSIPTLAGVLQENGYQTVGFYSGPYLSPAFGLDRGFQEYHDCQSHPSERSKEKPDKPSLNASHADVTNPILLDAVRRRLRDGLSRPFFLFMHFWDVHYDYIPPERYWRLFDPDYAGTFTGQDFADNAAFAPGMDERDFQHVLALYDGEIRYTDDTIEAILGELQQRGLLDDTLVVVTADHGDEFLEHGGKGHRRTLFGEVVNIPLIVWYPARIPAQRRADLASITDVAPTILALAGIAGGMNPTGASLLHPGQPDRALLLDLEFPDFDLHQVALRTANRKLIRYSDRRVVNGYDLDLDPNESRPHRLQNTAPEEFAALSGRLEGLVDEANSRAAVVAAAGPKAEATVDGATAERLRALGYH